MSRDQFAQTLLEHSEHLRRLAIALTRDPEAASDLVQETWSAALGSPPRRPDALGSWLAEVMRNLIRKGYRTETRRRLREASFGREQDVHQGEAEASPTEIARRLGELVDELPEPYRQTVSLRYYEGLSSAEIARKHGIPAGTVRSRLKQGLDQLRARLDERYGGDRRAWMGALLPFTGGGSWTAIFKAKSGGTGLTAGKGLAFGAAILAGVAVMAPPTPPMPLMIASASPTEGWLSRPRTRTLARVPAVKASPKPKPATPIETQPAAEPTETLVAVTLSPWQRYAQEGSAPAPSPIMSAAPQRDRDHILLRRPGLSMSIQITKNGLTSSTLELGRYGNTLRGFAFGAPIELDWTAEQITGIGGGGRPINLRIRRMSDAIELSGLYCGNMTKLVITPTLIQGHIGPQKYILDFDGQAYVGRRHGERAFSTGMRLELGAAFTEWPEVEQVAALAVLLAGFSGETLVNSMRRRVLPYLMAYLQPMRDDLDDPRGRSGYPYRAAPRPGRTPRVATMDKHAIEEAFRTSFSARAPETGLNVSPPRLPTSSDNDRPSESYSGSHYAAPVSQGTSAGRN